MQKPNLFNLCKTTFYIGTIGYGGPAILALMEKTFVNEKKWISEKEFMNALSLAQILPGATTVSVIGYIGFKLHKLWGAILAPLLYILPATTAITVLAWVYFTYGDLAFVKAIFAGLGALVVALLVDAIFILGRSVFGELNRHDIKGLIISLVAFVGLFVLKLNVIWMIIAAGLLGFLFFNFTHEFKNTKVKSKATLLDELDKGMGKQLEAKEILPIVLVVVIFGFGLMFPSVRGLIFSFLGIGSLAFGGGFAAVPLIQHQVVDVHGWLTLKQFIDGIALGQITPGPVFITATFIGYHLAGIAGALLATLAIFAPSLAGVILLFDVHHRVRELKIVKSVIKGILSGFIGILVAIALQFALRSLISWQTWFIFALAIVWLLILKKESVWAILGTIVLSFFIF